jgi:hypothetical protein
MESAEKHQNVLLLIHPFTNCNAISFDGFFAYAETLIDDITMLNAKTVVTKIH